MAIAAHRCDGNTGPAGAREVVIKLICRGQYDKPVQDEFEHMASRMATFLAQLFDEDGNYIQPKAGGEPIVAVPGVLKIFYGNVSINSGSAVGYSIPGFACDPTNCILLNNGMPSSSILASVKWDNTQVPGSWIVRAERSGTTGNQAVEYVILKVRLTTEERTA